MPRKKKSVRVVSSPRKASNRPAKLRNWRDEAMTGAIEAVKGGMGVNHAAKEFGVATTTLRDRLSGPVLTVRTQVQSHIYLPKRRVNLLNTSHLPPRLAMERQDGKS